MNMSNITKEEFDFLSRRALMLGPEPSYVWGPDGDDDDDMPYDDGTIFPDYTIDDYIADIKEIVPDCIVTRNDDGKVTVTSPSGAFIPF